MLNLSRSVGGSIGISVMTCCSRATSRSAIPTSPRTSPNIRCRRSPRDLTQGAPLIGDAAMAMLDAEINRQALMIAYIDDFRLMMLVTLASLPLVLLLRKAKPHAGGPPVIAD